MVGREREASKTSFSFFNCEDSICQLCYLFSLFLWKSFGGGGEYEKWTHSLGSQKEEKPIYECNKEAMWDDDVRTFFKNTARNKDKKEYVFFFSCMQATVCGRGRECSSESQKSLGATWGGDEPNERLTYQVDGKIGAYQANNG